MSSSYAFEIQFTEQGISRKKAAEFTFTYEPAKLTSCLSLNKFCLLVSQIFLVLYDLFGH